MGDSQSKELSSRATERTDAALERAIAQIESLAQSVDAVQLFVATVANMSFAPEGSISEATHGDVPAKIETLAYHLYPFFEVSSKEVSSKSEITPLHINECIESLGTIVTMRLIGSVFSDRATTEPNEADSIATLARMQAEIVRGSAYPEQTGMEISSIQGHFDSWFVKVVGISPTKAKDLLWAIIRHQERALNSVMPEIRAKAKAARKHWRAIEKKPASQRNADETRLLEVFENDKAAGVFEGVMALNLMAPHVIPVERSDLSDLEPPPTSEEWDGLISLIGMTTDVRSQMSAPVDVRKRPLFVLPDN
ncbi:MAG: hypothetical protein ACE5JC_10025, partial [Candidatus Zixiibacteriota bacterium]